MKLTSTNNINLPGMLRVAADELGSTYGSGFARTLLRDAADELEWMRGAWSHSLDDWEESINQYEEKERQYQDALRELRGDFDKIYDIAGQHAHMAQQAKAESVPSPNFDGRPEG